MTRKPKGINRPGSGSGWNDDYRVFMLTGNMERSALSGAWLQAMGTSETSRK